MPVLVVSELTVLPRAAGWNLYPMGGTEDWFFHHRLRDEAACLYEETQGALYPPSIRIMTFLFAEIRHPNICR